MRTITQETYDETLLENQDLFDLSPNDAITETLSQFSQQGLENLDSYLVTSHPESKEGIQERATRKDFQTLLSKLESVVQGDGTISLGADAALSVNDILGVLTGIQDFCSGTYVDEEEEEIGEETKSDTDPTSRAVTKTKSEKSLPFLNLLHSSQNFLTLLSFLGVVSIPLESNGLDWTNDSSVVEEPSIEQMQVFGKVVPLITVILTPKSNLDRQIKSNLKDQFLCMKRLVGLLSYFLHLFENSSRDEETIISYRHTLEKLISLSTVVCRNSERNKVAFVRAFKNSSEDAPTHSSSSAIFLVVQICRVARNRIDKMGSSSIGILTNVCRLVAVLCRFDDFRDSSQGGGAGGLGVDSSYGQNVSSAHDHVLEFDRSGIVPVLNDITMASLKILGDGVEQENWMELSSVALAATRVLAVNDDIVQSWVAVGTLRMIQLALDIGIPDESNNEVEVESQTKQLEQIQRSRQELTSSAIGLIRNLCGNDEIKTTLCLGSSAEDSQSVLPSILKGMKLYISNASIQEHGCGAIAAMALRKPTNAMHIVHEGGADEILTAMKQFSNNVLVQRQGALAIRNIVSRLVANTTGNASSSNQDAKASATAVRDIFLDLGAEVILRNITGRHQGSVDEAYAALRDLGCEVSMAKIDSETGKVTTRTEMFGDKKPNFRPVYEDS